MMDQMKTCSPFRLLALAAAMLLATACGGSSGDDNEVPGDGVTDNLGDVGPDEPSDGE